MVFTLTIICIFLSIAVESAGLALQLKGRVLTRMFGVRAFYICAVPTLFFWTLSFICIAALQFFPSPCFHHSNLLAWAGAVLIFAGLALSIRAYALLGLRRSLCINFFDNNVARVRHSIYRHMRNPMDTGFWIALIGFALATRSWHNAVIAAEYILLMIPHSYLENIPLYRREAPGAAPGKTPH
jgi:protein-S-isoprenylcysteine O-methyltransferase Ste14